MEALLGRAAEHGYPALALTDVENLYGQVKLHHAARAFGVRAITGVELRAGYGPGLLGRRRGRLVLLARDRAGYESLCRVVTWRRGIPREGDPLECLELGPRGVFFLSDDPDVIAALLRAGIAADDVRFLLVRPDGGPAAPGVRAIADPDVVMLDPADRDLHALLVAIRRRRTVDEIAAEVEPPERSLPSPDALRDRWRDAPEAIAETLRVAAACTLDLADARPVIPSLELPPGESAEDRLARLCAERLAAGRREGRGTGAPYDARLERELAVIRELGFAGYFLVVAEIADQARRDGLRVLGRGSAAGSLVAHLLGVGGVDPIEHGLLFERFLHAGRSDLPDVDLDLPSERRDAFLERVVARFGRERTAQVSAHGTFRRRGAWREGLRALGIAASEIERFAARMPPDELEDAGLPLPLELLPDRARAAAPRIERLVGRPQYVAVHAGGVVIADPRVDAHAPLERAPKGVLVTQYDMHSLERLGLVKFDLLGNRALSALEQAREWIPGPVEAPDHDPGTLATLRAGRTVGCFQIETPTVRSTLRQLPLRGIGDLIAALALVRPGPASGDVKAEVLRRARGEEPADPPHPRLEEVLRDTWGMPLYEEDLILSIARMTGLPPQQADEMRADLVRAGDDPVAHAGLERRFLQAAAASGVPANEAAPVWELLARFAAYSFNKAHAASYAQLAWECAYLKTHHAAALASGVLDHYGGNYPLRTVAADFARGGVRLLGPDVNRSAEPCTIEEGAVRIGLGRVKRLTVRNRARVLEGRPYADLPGFLARIRPSAPEAEALIRCGACDGLAPLSAGSYPFAHDAVLERLAAGAEPESLRDLAPPRAVGKNVETYRALVRISQEIRFLDMHPSGHPMAVLRGEAERAGAVPIASLDGATGSLVRIAGVVAASRRLAIRPGQVMQFVTLDDETGLIEGVLFPGVYAALGDPVRDPGPYLVGGRLAGEGGDVHLVVSEVTPFHRRARPYGR